MATDAEAVAAGFTMPQGSDYIKYGDDAVRENAKTTLDLINANKFKRGTIPANTDLYSYEGAGKDGVYACLLSSTAATLPNLPQEVAAAPAAFVLTVRTLNTTTTLELTTITVYRSDTYVCNSSPTSGTGWTPWQKHLFQGDVKEAPTPTAGFKAVPLALSAPANASSTETISAATLRYPLKFAVPIGRWRLHVQNINDRSGTVYPGAVSFTGAWTGAGSHSNGTFTGSPQKVMNAFTTPADGSEYVGPWITSELTAGQAQLLSLGFTNTAAQPNTQSTAGCFRNTTPGDAGVTAPTLTRSTTAPFSVWIEAEVPRATPVIAELGSSGAAGVGATLPMLDSPLSIHCRSVAALPVHYAQPGTTLSVWNDPAHHKWGKWAKYDRADALILSLGSNDLYTAGASLPDIQANAVIVAGIAAQVISRNIYAVTIHPRNTGDETLRRLYNTWLRTMPLGIHDLFDQSAAVSDDDETIRTDFNADGTHTNTAGSTAKAAAITRPVVSPPQKYTIDQSSGRVVKIWDYLNNREQLIYGDTGWRTTTPPVGQGAVDGLWTDGTGTIQYRRVNNTVYVRFEGVGFLAGAPAGNYLTPANFLPPGFRTWYSERKKHYLANVNGPINYEISVYQTSRLRVGPTVPGTGLNALQGTLDFTTDEVWPTTLPGTAVGSIPA
ncbi:SGNH/GDSL hydrolase family protein [Paeniglutamicibacter sp. NPDC012692]|uniref:SGNH/GDSL hydrolase family protein n=1 Tax=Paeniglutamicibacter sp. NPDC012692 TaxID=3364388 RepID=UPI0036958A22